MVARARSFADRRNSFVHSHYDMLAWDFRGQVKFEKEKGRFAGEKKKHEPQYESFQPEVLYKLANEIQKRVLPFAGIHDRINDELHPGWRDEELRWEMELGQLYDQMEVPEEVYESFRRLMQHLEVGSVPLPKPKTS